MVTVIRKVPPRKQPTIHRECTPKNMKTKQTAIKAAGILMDFGFIQNFISSKCGAHLYEFSKKRILESLILEIQKVLDTEASMAKMEGKLQKYLAELLAELSARGARPDLTKDGRTLVLSSSKGKRQLIPVLQIARDRCLGTQTESFVFNFLSSSGTIPFLRSSANLEELKRDADLIQRDFPNLFQGKAPKRGTSSKSKD